MKRPFLTLTTILILGAIIGAIIVAIINPESLVNYAETISHLATLWFLIGIGYALVSH